MTRDTKSSAIRAVLQSAGRPLTLDVLLPRLERRTRMVIGRQRLYALLSVMACNGDGIVIAGRGKARTYALRGRG